MRKHFSMAMAIAAGAVAVGFSCVASRPGHLER